MGKLDKLKSQIPQGSQELSTKNHLAKTEQEVSINDNDLRCAELAERLGFDDCRAMFTACQAL